MTEPINELKEFKTVNEITEEVYDRYKSGTDVDYIDLKPVEKYQWKEATKDMLISKELVYDYENKKIDILFGEKVI